MLTWALWIFILAVVAAVLGFGGIVADTVATISRVAFFVFLICFVVALLFWLEPRRKAK